MSAGLVILYQGGPTFEHLTQHKASAFKPTHRESFEVTWVYTWV
ncbi:MAG: hypothetical protein ACI9FJ_002290 [Alteromonadaceae bacterium]|jgi:hypothetical protein